MQQHPQDNGLIHNPRCFTWDYGGGDLDYPEFIVSCHYCGEMY